MTFACSVMVVPLSKSSHTASRLLDCVLFIAVLFLSMDSQSDAQEILPLIYSHGPSEEKTLPSYTGNHT